MQISLDQLKAACDRVLTAVQKYGVSVVDVPEDYYWFIAREKVYDPYDEPAEFTIGQLSDDWAEVSRIAAGETDAVPYALVWLSSVLRAAGDFAELGPGGDESEIEPVPGPAGSGEPGN
jgi:hypothetical protein